MSRAYADGDLIAHFQNGNINAIYTRQDGDWWRAPQGYRSGPDEGWDDLLDQGITGEAEHECGYVFAGNVRRLVASAEHLV